METIPTNLLPSQNVEAEMCTLGAMLLSEHACAEAQTALSPEDFYNPSHRIIFSAITELMLKHSAVDLVTLKNLLKEKDQLAQIGGVDYLIQIGESVPSAANVLHYANIVSDKASERRLEETGNQIAKLVHDNSKTTQEKVDKAEQLVYEVGRNQMGKYFTHVKGLARGFFDEVDLLMDTGQPILGMPTGYYDLDEMTGGLYPGDMTIIAARPSMGKTGLALNFALNIAQKNKGNVAVFSLEMSGSQLVKRMCAMLSGVGLNQLRKTNLASDNYDKLADACETLYSLPIYIDDTSDISPLEMRGKCRRLQQDGGLSLVVIDYLQLMRGSRKTESRTQEISEIARSVKGIAKEFGVPVIALSQLNRSVESREDKRPMLSDLRESGSIEAEADLVAFIYRDAYYKAKEFKSEHSFNPNEFEEAEIIIAKHRNGPTGKVMLGFLPSCIHFANLKQGS